MFLYFMEFQRVNEIVFHDFGKLALEIFLKEFSTNTASHFESALCSTHH